MTNDKFKPFVPKTYQQFVLEEQQEQNQVENKSVADSYNSEVNSYGNLEVEKGYGPCYVCSKPERETWLQVSCPVPNCTNRSISYWYHTRCPGSNMKISNRGNLRCSSCSTSGKVGYWLFICSGHGGTPEYTTTGAFKRALSIVLGSDDCDEVITDLGAYIADPQHKNEWFR